MRKAIETQLKIGQVDISKIEFDLTSRDELPKLLLGLRHIYSDEQAGAKVFKILEEAILPGVDKIVGRPGMSLWEILVMGTIRLGSEQDYDKLHDTVNNHGKVREMLGISPLIESDKYYSLQRLKDNVALCTPEALSRISEEVVGAGHRFLNVEESELSGRCDSFVVETNVHFPTDINLLFDAVRVLLRTAQRLGEELGNTRFRKNEYRLRMVKRAFTKVRKMKHSTSKRDEVREKRAEAINKAYQDYINLSRKELDRVEAATTEIFSQPGFTSKFASVIFEDRITTFIGHGRRQINQIERRIFRGEQIPHEEKVFSLFEPHTEWISKGKAGVRQELGVRVCVLEDQHRFILHHLIMFGQTDDKVTLSMVEETKEKFSNLHSVSFDKGFYTPGNLKSLNGLIKKPVLPPKGTPSGAAREREQEAEFIQLRHLHSAVESGINGLEHGGLDRCRDKGVDGFERYVAYAVLARNLHTLGGHILERKKTLKKRRVKLLDTRDLKKRKVA